MISVGSEVQIFPGPPFKKWKPVGNVQLSKAAEAPSFHVELSYKFTTLSKAGGQAEEPVGEIFDNQVEMNGSMNIRKDFH